jgi:acetyltransferase-like isoleucine patch superfamily enzyme
MLAGPKKEVFAIQQKLFGESKSQSANYREVIIGQRGRLALVRYELVMLVASWVPGALGLFLRSKLYPLLLGTVGKGVVFGTNVVLRHPHKIHLGNDVVIDDNCVLDAKGTSNRGIFIGSGVFIGRNSIVYCKDGDIMIGDNTTVSFNCDIFSGNLVRLGRNIQIAAYTFLNGGTHDFDRIDLPVQQQGRSGRGIVVEDNVWLGANVKVLDGVSIGQDAIVGAGAVVTDDLPALSIAAGMPARVIRMRGGSR